MTEKEQTAEELESGGKPDSVGDDGPTTVDRLGEHAEPLLAGESISTPLGPLPAGGLKAIGVFLLVFLVTFFALWGLLGGVGLLLGIVAGSALGFVAVKLMAENVSPA